MEGLALYGRFVVYRQVNVSFIIVNIFETSHERTNNLDFRQGPKQTGLYSHRT